MTYKIIVSQLNLPPIIFDFASLESAETAAQMLRLDRSNMQILDDDTGFVIDMTARFAAQEEQRQRDRVRDTATWVNGLSADEVLRLHKENCSDRYGSMNRGAGLIAERAAELGCDSLLVDIYAPAANRSHLRWSDIPFFLIATGIAAIMGAAFYFVFWSILIK